VSQKRPTFGLLCLWHTWTDFDIFGRNITDKVSNQDVLRLKFLVANWRNTKNCIFHSNARTQPLLLDFFNHLDSRLILPLIYVSLNLVIDAFSSGPLCGMIQEKGSWERCSSRAVLQAPCMHQCAVFWVYSFAR